MTRFLLQAKKGKGLSFEDLGSAVPCGEVWISPLFHRQVGTSGPLVFCGAGGLHSRTRN